MRGYVPPGEFAPIEPPEEPEEEQEVSSYWEDQAYDRLEDEETAPANTEAARTRA